MLRGLSGYYAKEPTLLLLVRAAQGLVHMGKGLLGLAPYHTDGQLASGAAACRARKALPWFLYESYQSSHPLFVTTPYIVQVCRQKKLLVAACRRDTISAVFKRRYCCQKEI